MKKFHYLFLLTFVIATNSSHGSRSMVNPSLNLHEGKNEKYTVSGYVKDAETGEELIGATVSIKELMIGTSTNVYGFYSLSLPSGTYNLTYNFISYQTVTNTIELTNNKTINIELNPASLQLMEVTIDAEKEDENLVRTEMSVETMDVKSIKKMPQVLGEADILRSVQLLPGVTSVGEGAGGFNVRGGGVDQNLILLDEAPVYNSSHLFGFFSVFNADAIKDIKLYKGGIPAKYGGRLSSVMDVRQKEGNMKKFSSSGGLGMLASRLTLEIPVIKNKSSLLIAGRRSYMDLFLKASPDFKDYALYFYDLNVKGNYKINPNNRLFLSGYFGQDVIIIGDLIKAGWGNSTFTLRWNHLFNDKLFSNFSAIYSKYDYNLGIPEGVLAFDWTSNIINYNLKSDLFYFPNPNNTIHAGVDFLIYKFKPGVVKGIGDATLYGDFTIEDKQAVEPAIYVSNEQKVSSRFTVKYGVRYSVFNNYGKATIYEYQDDNASSSVIIDSAFYDKFELIKGYSGLEPRIAANYKINGNSSVKTSYNRLRQYIHLVSNTSSPLPMDVYTPSGKYVKPAIVDQVALGYFRNFSDNIFETSVEVYYKNYRDLLDFKDGAQLFLNKTLETELLSGKGRAYGIEWMVRKQKGRIGGMASYTLSRTERQVVGININKYFPANSDKLHDLSIILNYDLTEKWNISTNFVLMSGKPFTYPEARYEYEGIIIPKYSDRNAGRTFPYHRLDIAATYTPSKKKGKKMQSSWNFGAYNVYARQNAYSIFFRQNEDNPLKTEAVRLSIFGTIIPYFTYNFEF